MNADERRAAFETAFEAYTPTPAGESGVGFQRTHAGLRAAFPERPWRTDNRWDGILHQIACWHSDEQQTRNYPGGPFAGVLISLRAIVDKIQIPAKPYCGYSSISEPAKPIEADAREYFKQAFKKRFPEHRINSQFAKDKWESARERVLEILTAQYQERLAEYNQRKAALDAQNNARLSEWQTEIFWQRDLRAFIAGIE